MSIEYSVGRQFAENLSQIAGPKAIFPPKPASIERRSRELDPVEEFEREWGFASFNEPQFIATASSPRGRVA